MPFYVKSIYAFSEQLLTTRHFLQQVGGTEEYLICDAMKSGRISKPLVAWCIGTCGTMFTSEVTLMFFCPFFVFTLERVASKLKRSRKRALTFIIYCIGPVRARWIMRAFGQGNSSGKE